MYTLNGGISARIVYMCLFFREGLSNGFKYTQVTFGFRKHCVRKDNLLIKTRIQFLRRKIYVQSKNSPKN